LPAEDFLSLLALPFPAGLEVDCTFFVFQKVPVVKEEDEPEEEDEEEMGHAETYAEYMPIKCMSLECVKIPNKTTKLPGSFFFVILRFELRASLSLLGNPSDLCLLSKTLGLQMLDFWFLLNLTLLHRYLKDIPLSQHQWLMPVILANQEDCSLKPTRTK
jgi:hypothetical protein